MRMCVLLCACEQKAGVSCDAGSGNSWINIVKKKSCLVGIGVVQLKTQQFSAVRGTKCLFCLQATSSPDATNPR